MLAGEVARVVSGRIGELEQERSFVHRFARFGRFEAGPDDRDFDGRGRTLRAHRLQRITRWQEAIGKGRLLAVALGRVAHSVEPDALAHDEKHVATRRDWFHLRYVGRRTNAWLNVRRP